MSLHIGKKIKEVAQRKRIGPTEFGKLINTSKQNIYGIYKRKSVDSDLLYKISDALKHDFFAYYYERTQKTSYLQEERATYETNTDLKEKLTKAKEEISSLKKENSYLKEIVELQKKQLEQIQN